MAISVFSTWNGKNGFEQFCISQTGCKPFSGAGICYRKNKKTTILRSVDGTYYYNDNLENINNPQYTLFGHNGDQDEKEPRFNEPLLNTSKTEKIYLYRVTKNKYTNETHYIWYGEYKIINKYTKCHPGKDCEEERNIIILNLKKIKS